LTVSIISLLLASFLTVTFPTNFDAQEAENLVRTKMIIAAAKYVSVSQAIDYTDYIIKAGHAYGINPILILALNITESELNHRARSPLGYRGIPQIPYHLPIPQSIKKGAEILRDKMVEADSVEEAIGAYKGFGFTTNAHTRKVMRLKREIETL
jgi:soluble lytic murein transglycosylase-like protein